MTLLQVGCGIRNVNRERGFNPLKYKHFGCTLMRWANDPRRSGRACHGEGDA